MISREDFKNNVIFANLTDEMLDKLIPIAQEIQVAERDYVFKEGDPVDSFYLIKRGTVLVEQRLSPKMTVTAGTLTVGEALGFSSLFEEGTYSTNAVCADQCDLIVMNGVAVMDILKKDHSMGFYVMQNIAVVFGHRLIRRTEQFLRAVTSHPEIHELEA